MLHYVCKHDAMGIVRSPCNPVNALHASMPRLGRGWLGPGCRTFNYCVALHPALAHLPPSPACLPAGNVRQLEELTISVPVFDFFHKLLTLKERGISADVLRIVPVRAPMWPGPG